MDAKSYFDFTRWRTRARPGQMTIFLFAAAIVAVVAAKVMEHGGVPPWALAVAAASIFPAVFAVLCFAVAYAELPLEARALSNDANASWDVSANGVSIGQMLDAVYARIVLDARRDNRVWFNQFRNVLHFFAAKLASAVAGFPVVCVGITLLLVVYSPESLDAFATTLREQGAAGASSALRSAWLVWLAAFVAVTSAQTALSTPKVFVSAFDEEIADRIRREMGCAANGRVGMRPSAGWAGPDSTPRTLAF